MEDARKIILRKIEQSDATAVLAAFRSHPDMKRQGDVSTIDEAHRYISQFTESKSMVAWVIDLDGRAVGLVGLASDPENRSAWFFYWMGAQYRGQGWTSIAARTVANWALSEGGFERLELGYRVNNPSSATVAQSAGFLPEGLERSKFLITGKRIDVVTCGRLPSDPWPQGPSFEILTR
ncbi:GNAT family N-acetyltransferase [Arcanobacterium phocisimile]|uniref:GNAT family N-acetyltransferase n=1 Tax=Arcanobacterium phocisimile TaxID=1302235 RepID=A0ABX7IFN0_9ACTO|nr:GNAT family protein [Arcanobacterium phocisimile]QRV01939.1 GNAT family N-acetyltransferase [Arcanobacterium phocisimile]